MKLLLTVFLVFFSLNCYGQNKQAVTLNECNGDFNNANCTYNTLRDFIANKLNEQDLKHISFSKERIIISAYLKFNELGKIEPKQSLLQLPIENTDSILEIVLSQIPNIKPQLNKKGIPKTVLIRETFGYVFDGTKLIPKPDYKSDTNDYSISQKVPVYKGCKPRDRLRNKKLRKCLNIKITKFIKQRFNTNVAEKLNIPVGSTIKIFVSFSVDIEGNIIDINAKSTYLPFVAEAIRVTKMVPNFDAPAFIGTKAVTVPYSFPIAFKVKSPKEKQTKL